MAKPTGPYIPSEDEEQIKLFQWVRLMRPRFPDLDMLYAVPNGGKRAISTARLMKATGTRAGVPDLCLPVARGAYHGLYIELKRIKGGKVSKEQAEWIEALRAQGYRAEVCMGCDRAVHTIIDYLLTQAKQ